MTDYVIMYQTDRVNGPGTTSYANIVQNAPSRDAVLRMFRTLMNGPSSEIWECREATTHDRYPCVPYSEWQDGHFFCTQCKNEITPDMPYHVIHDQEICDPCLQRLVAHKHQLVHDLGCHICGKRATQYSPAWSLLTCDTHQLVS